jgi:hypothetical protein
MLHCATIAHMTKQIQVTTPHRPGHQLAHTHTYTCTEKKLNYSCRLQHPNPQQPLVPTFTPCCCRQHTRAYKPHTPIVAASTYRSQTTPANPTCLKIAICSIRLPHAHTTRYHAYRKKYEQLSSQAKEAGAVSRPQPPLCTALAVQHADGAQHGSHIRLTSKSCR